MDNDLLNYISERYPIRKEEDGSYTIFCLDSPEKKLFSIKRIEEPLFPNTQGNSSNSSNRSEDDLFSSKNKINSIGRDDVEPNFNTKITRKGTIQGMFPDFENTKKPLIDTDIPLPGNKKKNNKNGRKYPEPDNDDFNPGKNLNEFD